MEKVKKIVLIGASGFVGSALLNEALNRKSLRSMKYAKFAKERMPLSVHSIRDGIILIYMTKPSKYI